MWGATIVLMTLVKEGPQGRFRGWSVWELDRWWRSIVNVSGFPTTRLWMTLPFGVAGLILVVGSC